MQFQIIKLPSNAMIFIITENVAVQHWNSWFKKLLNKLMKIHLNLSKAMSRYKQRIMIKKTTLKVYKLSGQSKK